MSCASRNRYAGPLPESAVTTSSASSLATQMTSPTDRSSCSATARCGAATARGANNPVAAAPTSAGRLGMARTTATPGPHQASSAATRSPAATETRSGGRAPQCPASAPSTALASSGFTASTTTEAPATAAALSAAAVMASSRARRSREAALGSPTLRCSGRVPERSSPVMRARPMLPAPSTAMRLLVMAAALYSIGQKRLRRLLPSQPIDGVNRAGERRDSRRRKDGRSRLGRAGSEQRGSQAHDRRALGDRGLEVAAHAHRQRVEPRAPGVELIAELAKLREPGALARRLGLLGWNAHQAAQCEARQRRDCRGEGAKLAGRDAALGGLARQIHLQADVEGRAGRGALCREPLRDPRAIERVHPGELLRDRTRPVGLHPPDEVPGQSALAQRGDLGQRLLQVALAEMLEAAGGGGAEERDGLRLADGEECDRLRTPAGRPGGPRHSFLHRRDAGGQILRTH